MFFSLHITLYGFWLYLVLSCLSLFPLSGWSCYDIGYWWRKWTSTLQVWSSWSFFWSQGISDNFATVFLIFLWCQVLQIWNCVWWEHLVILEDSQYKRGHALVNYDRLYNLENYICTRLDSSSNLFTCFRWLQNVYIIEQI